MVFKGVQSQKDRIEGVVDVGIIVIAHFENPANIIALKFLEDVLLWRKRCLVPNSTFIGAYHILTNYLNVEKASAYKALLKTLEVNSPAFHEDISLDLTVEALTNAMGYNIESWDGYIVALARISGAPIIYSLDKEMARNVTDLQVVNPIPKEAFDKYNNWLSSQMKAKRR